MVSGVGERHRIIGGQKYHKANDRATVTFFLLTQCLQVSLNIRMSYVLEILGKARILKNGRALIGFVFLISGVVILLDGAGRIRELWAQLAPYFPFALPKQAGESILQSLPRIFATFVSGVGSVSAVLFGGVWLLSGIGEVFRKEKTALEPPDLAQPEFVAESLAGAEAKYRKLPSFPMRILTAMVPRVRLSGPVALSMATSLFGSMIKIVLAAFLIGFFGYLLQLIPGLVQKYLHKAIIVAVPSPRPLYLVLGFLFILNGLIALSLLLRKRNEFVRGRESLPVN